MSHYGGPRRQLTCKNTGIKKVKGGKDDENLKQIIDMISTCVVQCNLFTEFRSVGDVYFS